MRRADPPGTPSRCAGLRVKRGTNVVFDGLRARHPARADHRVCWGRRGCGKTTLMRSIVGVQKIDGGTVTVLGEPAGTAAAAAPRRVRHAGGLGVRRPDHPRRTCATSPGSSARRAATSTGSSQRSGLADHARADRRLAQRRSGEPRLARGRDARLARAAWCSTSPPSGSTRCCAPSCGSVFRALADRGTTIIVSSHVMDEALRCDRLMLMRAGRIIADTTPGGLLADTGADRSGCRIPRADRARRRATSDRPASRARHGAQSREEAGAMNGGRTLATAGRVLRQLSHDPRSIALMLDRAEPARRPVRLAVQRPGRRVRHLRRRRSWRCSRSSSCS